MKVMVITSSPHVKGTSAIMAEQFIKGATEAGHEVIRFNAGLAQIHPCIACERCHTANDGCVFKDDMVKVNENLLDADAVIFITPIYYYTINAQLKVLVDRFYANNEALMQNKKKAALITTMYDDTMESADAANVWFNRNTAFLGWENLGTLNAYPAGTVDALYATDYPAKAYELGKSL